MKLKSKKNLVNAIVSFIGLASVVVVVSSYFASNGLATAISFFILGFVSLGFMKLYSVEISSVFPDIIFGGIDNGVLVFAAILGGHFAGVAGAVIGGAAGNTITDGIGGLFEGYIAENQRKSKIENERSSISSSLGKMSGCLFGASIGLFIVEIFKFLLG